MVSLCNFKYIKPNLCGIKSNIANTFAFYLNYTPEPLICQGLYALLNNCRHYSHAYRAKRRSADSADKIFVHPILARRLARHHARGYFLRLGNHIKLRLAPLGSYEKMRLVKGITLRHFHNYHSSLCALDHIFPRLFLNILAQNFEIYTAI